MSDGVSFLRRLFDEAVAAVGPARTLPPFLPAPPPGRTVVVGLGKAASSMARAVEAHWPPDAPLGGIVVTRHRHAAPLPRRIAVIEAGHPLPDRSALDAGSAILDQVRGLTPQDLVLCLVSGGGSALCAAPVPGVTLDDKRSLTAALLRSGAAIGEINLVRRHLSRVKGGRLALACRPAPVVGLIVSDVPGDDPGIVASGPTVADASTPDAALAVLARFGITPPPAVAAHLGSAAARTATPGPADFAHVRNHIIATSQHALDAAAFMAKAAGIEPVILGGEIEGEARVVGQVHAAIARQIVRHGQPAAAPAVILSGGETSVTVRGDGRGARNAEFLLAFGRALGPLPGISALACDTDGIDGSEDNAGAVWRPDTLARAGAQALDPRAFLDRNDAYGFFASLGDLVTTGPTQTNVNDFRAILVTRA